MTHDPAAGAPPSPALLMETITAYQRSAAIRAGIELDLFTHLADGPRTAAELGGDCGAPERGVRILCDYLTVSGFLSKSGNRYALTRDSAVFLNRRSPAYAGGIVDFLLSPDLRHAFDHLTAAARVGGAAHTPQGTVAAEHPVWMSFARCMGPMMAPAAEGLADLLAHAAPRKVLDVSASHGMWGIALARRHPEAELVALDWAPVLEVTRENAAAAGLEGRLSLLPGDAFEVSFGEGYDVVLAPNFLHHFSTEDCVRFLRKAHAALRPGGSVAIVEFVPNPDRVTPPAAATFSLVMLATTPQGDAYTFAEYESMLSQAGFGAAVQHPLPASANVAVIASK